MAGYPYTGGMNGGYSDPANNKKNTFIGPEADQAVKGAINPLATGVKQSYGSYRSGVQDTLDKTKTAYNVGGLGSAAGQYVRGTIGDAGNALAQGVVKPAVAAVAKPVLSLSGGVSNFAKTMLTGDPNPIGSQKQTSSSLSPNENTLTNSLARKNLIGNPPQISLNQQPTYALNATGAATNALASGVLANKSLRAGRELVTPSNQVADAQSGLLGQGGIRYDKQADGSTTYSMGKRGDGNYASLNRQPVNPLARQALVSGGQQTREIGGLTVTGSQDAVNRLASPVGTYDRNSPEYNLAQAQNYQKANPYSQNNPYDDRFGYKPPQGSDSSLIAPPPVAMGGGGWKSQVEADRANAAAYGDYARALSSAQGAAAQERGANYRADLQFKSQQGENDIARQRLMGDQGLNDARIKTEGINQQKGQMEIESLQAIKAASDEYMKSPTPENERKYRALVGKFEKEPQYGTVGRFDDTGMKIGEDLYNKQTGELVRRDDGDRLHPLPEDRKNLVKGRIYITPKGVGQWDGEGHFDMAWYQRGGQSPQQTTRPPAAPVQPSTGQLMP